MQDQHTLQHYGIVKDSTIILNLRLRGGCKGSSSKNTGSFHDAIKGKDPLQHRPAPTPEIPGPYIVEQRPESPMLTVSLPEVTDLYTDLIHNAVICRFNGYWPKADALHQWVFDRVEFHLICSFSCVAVLLGSCIAWSNFATTANHNPFFLRFLALLIFVPCFLSGTMKDEAEVFMGLSEGQNIWRG